ncbi:dihydrofolate reductase [Chlamydia vaughanii]|uniref:dihydrofolate reductase n=1 Tax=Chlamydia vaughanii TaxID=3112552 RepID=UPI0032B0F2DB
MKTIFGVAACDPNGVIGNQGKLPWSYPEDINFFSTVIGKRPIIMGRKTWEALPSKYSADRQVVIFSRSYHEDTRNIFWVSSLEEFNSLELSFPVFLIGGGDIFSLFLENHMLRGCFITHIKKCYEGDIFFPLFLLEGWKKKVLDEKEGLTICYYENLSYCHTHNSCAR